MSNDRPLDEQVRYDLEDGVARITIDREEAKNALTWDMRDRIGDLMEEASADLGVRAVVVTGAGSAFCAGADLRKPQPKPERPEGAPVYAVGDITRLLKQGWQRLVSTILECRKPVVAAVNGVAAGGGCQLALACDLVVAAESASFVQAFVKRGIVPDAGAAYVVTRLVGPQRAKELLFLGDRVRADQAEAIGLVNRVVPDQQLTTTVDELVGRLAALPTAAIGLTKQLVNKAYESDLPTALHDEAVNQELAQGTHDAKEGVQAFKDRREPEFKGW